MYLIIYHHIDCTPHTISPLRKRAGFGRLFALNHMEQIYEILQKNPNQNIINI
jgi:hypothetical protein